LEQGDADLAQRRVDVGFGQRPALPQPVEHVGQAIAQRFEQLGFVLPGSATQNAPVRDTRGPVDTLGRGKTMVCLRLAGMCRRGAAKSRETGLSFSSKAGPPPAPSAGAPA